MYTRLNGWRLFKRFANWIDYYTDPTFKDFVYIFFTFFLQTCYEGDLSFPNGLLVKFGCGCHGH